MMEHIEGEVLDKLEEKAEKYTEALRLASTASRENVVLEIENKQLKEDYETIKKWQEHDKNREIVQKVREFVKLFPESNHYTEIKEILGEKI